MNSRGACAHGGHDHCPIIGMEGGMKRSVWAQRYPDVLCHAICAAVEKNKADD